MLTRRELVKRVIFAAPVLSLNPKLATELWADNDFPPSPPFVPLSNRAATPKRDPTGQSRHFSGPSTTRSSEHRLFFGLAGKRRTFLFSRPVFVLPSGRTSAAIQDRGL
jgi:hypothetical protein